MVNPTPDEGMNIAVIGIAGRFPGAANPEQFWRNIHDGVESIVSFSDDELLAAGIDPEVLKDPHYVKAGAILDDIEGFDSRFFGYTPRETEILDPQQRLFLEIAWEVLENAGYDLTRYRGSVGVFAGSGLSAYFLRNLYPNRDLWNTVGDMPLILGNDKDSLTTRVAYFMDLTGPCCTVQTYCSTSLVAVCLACESLLSGESDMAMAGGVSLLVPQKAGYYYQEGGIASPDARCRAFDAKAKGAPLGSGAAVVLLKRLEDAMTDGDTVYAVIRGWAVNNDGAMRTGYTAPGVRGQAEVITEALANAEVEARSISYIEAHGTGTALGDAVEFAALVKAFREHTGDNSFCAVASVKTNVGHLDRAAGTTSLIKAALALKHQVIPPSLNYDKPNPEIDFAQTPFYVNTQLRPWVTENGWPRRVGVSAFGIGGTNAHVILEEAPTGHFDEAARPYQLLLLSARSAAALDQTTANLLTYLSVNPAINMADVAYVLQVGRQAFEHRRAFVCQGYDDAVAVLAAEDKTRLLNGVNATQERPVVFMFPGVGDHYVHMGRELYEREPVFREAVTECCRLLRPILAEDLEQILYPPDGHGINGATQTSQGINLRQMLGRENNGTALTDSGLKQTAIAQPAVFVLEYALSKLLQSWGLQPDALIGYSLGEYVAACVAGVLTLADALQLVAGRAQMIQKLPAGGMLSVALSEEGILPYLDDQICLGVVNGPGNCVLSGPLPALAQVEQRLAQAGVVFRRLDTSHAFHSTMMDPIVPEFTALLESISLQPPQIPYVSNVTGNWITEAEATDPAYWVRHLCQTVRFGDGLAQLLSEETAILLEVGPGQSLGAFAKQHPHGTKKQMAQILPCLRYAYDQQSDLAFLLTMLGKLWLTGLSLDWAGFYRAERRQRIPLPTYPFERQRYWIDPPQVSPFTTTERLSASGKKARINDWFYEPVWEIAPLPAETENRTDDLWLVFEDDLGWGAALARRLREQGANVIRVQRGTHFEHASPDLFTLRPDVAADYGRLFETLKTAEKTPARLVHLWSLGETLPELAGAKRFQAAQQTGFYSLLFLAQALGKRYTSQPLQLVVITSGVQSVKDEIPLCPENATILGACRVIPQEYQNIRCRTVDITLPGAAAVAEQQMQLVRELMMPDQEVTVAYRDGVRYRQQFKHHPLMETDRDPFRSHGVYMITGGLGNIGLLLATYLAQQYQARVALIGRSGLPERALWDDWVDKHGTDDPTSRKIQAVRNMESYGADVLVLAADVANQQQMQSALAQIEQTFGALHGVIHAAGLTNLDYYPAVQETEVTVCEAHFQSKVYGLYVLDELLQSQPLEFRFMFSSLSVVLGGLGFVGYAAANSFMDSYAHAHRHKGSDRWTTVDWDTWRLEPLDPGSTNLGATVAEFEMTPEEGLHALRLALSHGLTQLVNSTGDLQTRIRQWVLLEAFAVGDQGHRTSHSRPDLATAYAPPENEYQKRIAAIWENILGISPVGIHDNFFELGGHSLLALQIMGQLRQVYQVPLPLSVLLMTPTVGKLAIAVELAIIEEIESLTEEELVSMA